MNKLLYLSDDEVQSQLAAKYDLLVHFGPKNLQYAIIDAGQKETKVLAEYEIPALATTSELIHSFENLPESNRQFRFAFNKVKISFTTSNYTFIPADLFEESDQQQYGEYINLTDARDVLVDTISSAQIKNVTAIDSDFKTALAGIFNNHSIYNQASPFLEGAQKALQRDSESIIFIDFQPEYFQISYYKDFKLEFYNTFEYQNADEFNYYLLNVIQSLEIVLGDTQIVLSGKISKQDEVYQRIGKYFETVRLSDAADLNKYSSKFGEVQAHTFSTLFSLDLCE